MLESASCTDERQIRPDESAAAECESGKRIARKQWVRLKMSKQGNLLRRGVVAMRNLILLGLLTAMVLPAGAAKRLTVAQLEKTLEAANEKHRADEELVRLLGEAVLTERLTGAARERISAGLHPGPKASLALQLLADQSAFLDPPAAELPAAAAPDAALAERILNAARAYVVKTLPRLPDFFATRITNSFDNGPQVLKANEWPVRAGLHLVGSSSREISYRDDQLQVATPQPLKTTPGSQAIPEAQGLQTRGEFGLILAMIFVDTAKGALSFHHWEQGTGGPIAVYRYFVPKSASTYSVDYCCTSLGPSGRQVGGRRSGSALMVNSPGDPTTSFHKTPGYHGSLFIDPASGTILRITLEAEMGSGPVSRLASVIEYGPMVIGDKRYICPLWSMALTEAQDNSNSFTPAVATDPYTGVNTIVVVNETSFTNYHRLGSTTRIVTEAEAPQPSEAPLLVSHP